MTTTTTTTDRALTVFELMLGEYFDAQQLASIADSASHLTGAQQMSITSSLLDIMLAHATVEQAESDLADIFARGRVAHNLDRVQGATDNLERAVVKFNTVRERAAGVLKFAHVKLASGLIPDQISF